MSSLDFGDVPASDTLYIPFDTFDANGASVTMTGFALGDILVYKNGSTTQRSSTAGFTLLDTDGIDFDGLTGIHGFSIDLSNNTDAGFYAVGSRYWVVVSTVTVSGQTISFVAATFRIVAAESVAGKPKVDVDVWNGATGPVTNLSKTAAAIGRGTVTTGASTTSVPTSAFTPTGAVADQFKGRVLLFDADTATTTLRGVAATISASSNAAAPTFTVGTLPATPASGDTFSVL